MEIKTECETEIGPTQVAFKVVPLPKFTKKIEFWSDSETQKLLDLYESFVTQVGPQKRFMHKKDMWTEIATHFPGRHRKQCDERHKTVLKRKKKGLLEPDDFGTEEVEEYNSNPFEIIEKLKVEQAAEEKVKPSRRVHMWSNNETKLLMSLYRTLIWDVGKRFTFQKEMWREIALHFPGKNANQCEQRYKTVLKRKKKEVLTKSRRKINDFRTKDYVGNSVLRNKRITKTVIAKTVNDIEMRELITLGEEEIIKEAIKTEEEVIKEPQMSVEEVISCPEIPETSSNCTTNNDEPFKPERKDLSLPEILWEIAAKKEEAKERRHRERMEATKQLQNILQQILNSKNI